MLAISKGKFRTTVEAPKGATEKELIKKANKYIKGTYKIVTNGKH